MLIGAGLAALTNRFLLNPERRLEIPPGGCWLCLLCSGFAGMWVAIHTTMPSLATRVTVVGYADDCVEVRSGTGPRASSKFQFRFIPEDGGSGGPVDLESEMPGPMCWLSTRRHDRRRYRITYLATSNRSLRNEVIETTVLAGPDTGWHSPSDARPLGLWLAMPPLFALTYLGMFALSSRRKDEKKERRRLATME